MRCSWSHAARADLPMVRLNCCLSHWTPSLTVTVWQWAKAVSICCGVRRRIRASGRFLWWKGMGRSVGFRAGLREIRKGRIFPDNPGQEWAERGAGERRDEVEARGV